MHPPSNRLSDQEYMSPFKGGGVAECLMVAGSGLLANADEQHRENFDKARIIKEVLMLLGYDLNLSPGETEPVKKKLDAAIQLSDSQVQMLILALDGRNTPLAIATYLLSLGRFQARSEAMTEVPQNPAPSNFVKKQGI